MLRVRILLALLSITATRIIAKTTGTGYTHYRLPRALIPLHYKLRILTQLEAAEDFLFTGDVQIELQVNKKTKNITLHAQKLDINASKLRVAQLSGDAVVDIKEVQQNEEHSYYIILLTKALKPGTNYLLTMQFAGKLNRQMRGYYLSSYKAVISCSYLSITQFEPANARTAFPCFDEPEYKATFAISLGHEMRYRALSNMPLKDTMPIFDRQNWQWSIFEESVPMSTYLVAYSINDFASTNSLLDIDGVKFNTWARPDAIAQCNYAADIGPRILAYYEEIFGIKFPLSKIDQVAVPDFNAGAMENWGLITYRESALLYDAKVSSFSDKQRIAEVVAHELAHQWFGNLVTMKWWTELWLNEGFATYVASLGVGHLSPEWQTYDEESLENSLEIFHLDALCCSHAITQEVREADKISDVFDSISYKKGSAIIRMMHMFMGDEAFRAGLNAYLEKYAYKNADQQDLWDALSLAAHKKRSMAENLDIATIMNTWTMQTGYPLVTIKRDYAAGTAALFQMRYLLAANDSIEDDVETDGCWFVPLSYTTARAADFTMTLPRCWLECDQQKRQLPLTLPGMPPADEWLLLNVQLSGLYRVDYDAQNWQLLIATLRSDEHTRIHVLNRAQVIDDALNLAWSGQHNYARVFELLQWLQSEREYEPWKAALDNLSAVNRILRQTPDYEPFQRYMRHLLLPMYMQLQGLNVSEPQNLQEKSESGPYAIRHKLLIASWACRFDLADCVKCALAYFRTWRASTFPDQHNSIPNDLRTVVYCTAMRHGNEHDWNFLWLRYQNSNVAGEKRVIISALGCTREVWLLHRYLAWAYDAKSDIRKQYAAHVFYAVARSEIGYQLARDFLMCNIEFLFEFYEPHTAELIRMLPTLASEMSTLNDLEELQAFIDKHADLLQPAEQGARRAVEMLQLNMQWRAHSYYEFTRRLERYLEI